MGISAGFSRFLFYSKQLGVSFKSTLQLGRLNLYASKEDIEEQINLFRNNERPISGVEFKDDYSEPLFEILGAQDKVESVDYSDYEKATIIHDLNEPFPESFRNRFTAIVDGGTIEHVFNFPLAMKNVMSALAVGGHYIAMTPANNTMGHGFYQFSPELYFRVFSEDNGFETVKMVISTRNNFRAFTKWYEVSDPQKVRGRVVLLNNMETHIFVVAKKLRDVPLFTKTPQQSDYQALWNEKEGSGKDETAVIKKSFKQTLKNILPPKLTAILRNVNYVFSAGKSELDDLGVINRKHFREITIP